MSIVAGVDYGTLSVRVSIVDSERGRIGSGVSEYPLNRKREDPDYATQAHAEHMRALAEATHKALASAGVAGDAVEAIAVDTTGSSIIPVDDRLEPIDDYYLWCDHRASREAALITETAQPRMGLAAIDWCGGVYSSEWGFSKLLHWLRHNPDKRANFCTVLEHCDMVAATLCGIHDPLAGAALRLRHGPQVDVERSARRIAAGGVSGRSRSAAGGRAGTSGGPLRDQRPDRRQAFARVGGEAWACARAFRFRWARSTRTGTPSARACSTGDVVNVVGTSTCIMAIADKAALIPGVCGVVQGSVHPGNDGNRSRPFGHRRYLRSHRAARRDQRLPRSPRAGEVSAPDRPACCA